jgi:hypothetical protein
MRLTLAGKGATPAWSAAAMARTSAAMDIGTATPSLVVTSIRTPSR